METLKIMGQTFDVDKHLENIIKDFKLYRKS